MMTLLMKEPRHRYLSLWLTGPHVMSLRGHRLPFQWQKRMFLHLQHLMVQRIKQWKPVTMREAGSQYAQRCEGKKPTEHGMRCLKHATRYLMGTADYGVWLPALCNNSLGPWQCVS